MRLIVGDESFFTEDCNIAWFGSNHAEFYETDRRWVIDAHPVDIELIRCRLSTSERWFFWNDIGINTDEAIPVDLERDASQHIILVSFWGGLQSFVLPEEAVREIVLRKCTMLPEMKV